LILAGSASPGAERSYSMAVVPECHRGREQRLNQTGSKAMAAHAGENARKTGDFRCEQCHERVHVTRGDKIPKCRNCGNDTFDTREHEPDTND
jgi:hypothetical protein